MNTEELGKAIRKRRKSLKVDQVTLARLSGISVHALSNIEAAKASPTLQTLNKVLHTLGMELEIKIKTLGLNDA